jgi:hypothetical protein
MIAHTWSEIFVVFSLTIGWLICAGALVAPSAASIRSIESDFMVFLLSYVEVLPRSKTLRTERNLPRWLGKQHHGTIPA